MNGHAFDSIDMLFVIGTLTSAIFCGLVVLF